MAFKTQKKKLEDIKKSYGVEFDFYLWHDNANDGEVEDLLTKLIPANKTQLLDCIHKHKKCLSSLPIPDLAIPDKKKVLNYYIFTLNLESHNYNNAEAWNLNIDACRELSIFKSFLDRYFKNEFSEASGAMGNATETESLLDNQ